MSTYRRRFVPYPKWHKNLSWFSLYFFLLCFCAQATAQRTNTIPIDTMLRIVRAEDTRRWDADLPTLLTDNNADVRQRAALAAGRIGDERAVPALISLLQKDSDTNVRAMAAFALGEVESATAADALIAVLSPDKRESGVVRGRAVEALGKIAAAIPKSEDARAQPLRQAILGALEFEAGRRSAPDEQTILLGLTAALRARPEKAGPTIADFLGYSNPRIRADAANTLARLKLSDGNAQLRKLLTEDSDPVVRANAARVLGATEDKPAIESLLDRAVKDNDLRVRVSAIRALAALKDQRAVAPLLDRGQKLLGLVRQARSRGPGLPAEINEIIEIAAAMGRLSVNSNDELVIDWLTEVRYTLNLSSPEVEVAFARVAPQRYQIEARENLRPSTLGIDLSGAKYITI